MPNELQKLNKDFGYGKNYIEDQGDGICIEGVFLSWEEIKLLESYRKNRWRDSAKSSRVLRNCRVYEMTRNNGYVTYQFHFSDGYCEKMSVEEWESLPDPE